MPVLADQHARLAVEPGQRHEHGRVLLALLGAVERDGAVGAVPQQVAYAEPLGRPGQLHRLPDRPARRGRLRTRTGSAGGVGGVHEHGEGQVDQHGQVLGGHHRVDDALLGEVLGLLDAGRERVPLERLVDLRARGSPTSAPGSATVTWPERAPRRVDAAGRRVAQVHEVGQPGSAVRHHRPGDRHHLEEGRRALLHPGAAGGGGREQRAVPRAVARRTHAHDPLRPPPGRSSRRGRRTR